MTKRHSEINSLLKENTRYKNQVDEIRRKYGDFSEIDQKIKIAQLKEEKINNLLSKLDHVMKSTESNLSCYSCMNLVSEPAILIPCGHSFCKACVKQTNKCPECEK
mmetsp:Transcript_28900/g.27803  ORF Transcript_28900/g.27803 Transcript_28900/m.27803 type:complete len:106 (+) Transcript_28900:232-549(+)